METSKINHNLEEKKGVIFDIQRYAVHDGPGIRTLVFFKGCPLRCLWCDNPESQQRSVEIGFAKQNCIGCGKCFEVCPESALHWGEGRVDRKKCTVCGKCTEVCFARALTLIGREITVTEVLREIERDRIFYRRSGGGVTFSGGEPLSQPEFLVAVIQSLRQVGIHTAIETSGYAPEHVIREVFPLLDLILYDIKHMNPEKHKAYTGVSNDRILDNLVVASTLRTEIIIRVPLIPGCNDSEDNIDQLVYFAKKLRAVREIHLLPYHRLGQHKYAKLGRSYPLDGVSPPPKERVVMLARRIEQQGFNCVIGG